MELVLEEAAGIPEGGILSLKIGDSKRQGPAATLGSRFSFGAVPAGPVNVKVELLAPAAEPQFPQLDPKGGACSVDFGGGARVRLLQREAAKPRQTKVDVNRIMDTRNLPSEKLQTAQNVARYLEEHDIVQTLQEILHGLLLSRPDDPFAFIDENLARARSVSESRRRGVEEERCEEQQCRVAAKAMLKDIVARVEVRCEAREAAHRGKGGEAGQQQGGSTSKESVSVSSGTRATSSSEGSPFDGCWLEGAEVHTIRGTELRWANGVCTDIDFTGEDSFSVVLYGKAYDAELKDEGRALKWCDGDLWHRTGGEPGDCQLVKVNKVEVLLGSMHSLKRSLPMVLPALPQDLRNLLVDPQLSEECQQRFNELDRSCTGKLDPQDLLPVVGSMSSARRQSITPEQCQRFAGMFDVNKDGAIQQGEFTELMRFSLIARYLESDEGREVATMVHEEDRLFQEFLQTLEQDMQRMNEVVPLLPKWLQDHLKSEEFKAEWMEYFDRLDQDKNEALDPVELLPEVLRLSEAHPLTIDIHKSRQFAAIFDKRKDGFIRRDEWLELAKFLSVMCYLGGEEEPANERGMLLSRRPQLPAKRVEELLAMLQEDPNRLSEVIPFLPEVFKADIMSDGFVKACLEDFQRLEQSAQGGHGALDLVPLVFDLCEARGLFMAHEECLRIASLFCGGRTSIPLEEAVYFARFALTMALLSRPISRASSSVALERQQPKQPTEQLLRALQADAAKLGEVVAFLPMRVKAPLLTSAFAEECLAVFDSLDASSRGALAPEALIAAVARLGRSWSMPAAEERFQEFLGLLSSGHSSAIRRGEFVSFVHFLLALAYLESEEGKAIADEAQLALGRRRVEELLAMLERDRQSVHKVVPMLPPELAEHLASEQFAASSGRRFAELNVGRLGHLRPLDLVPIVVELSMAQPAAVDADACRRFLAIFSTRSDGVMHEGEFLEFSRFLCIMSFLHSKEGQRLVREAISVMDDSFKVDELLAMLRTDRLTLQQVLQYLPGWLQTELLAEDFDATWLRHFEELDISDRGLLQHGQLSKRVTDCPVAQCLSLDAWHCERYAALFDDAGSGILKKADCPDFVRFLLVLAFLESQDGQKRLDSPVSEQRGASRSNCSSPATLAVDHLGAALCTRKMQTDLDHYRILAQRLEQENEIQREHILRMQAALHQRGEAHGYHAGAAELNLGAMPVPVG